MDTHYATAAAWISGRLVRLPNRTLVDTDDVEEAETVIGSMLSTHHIDLKGPAREFRALVRECAIGDLRLAHFKYGTAITVHSAPLDCYAVNLTLRGRSEARHGPATVAARTHDATVFSPFDASSLSWSDDAEVLCLTVPKQAVEQHLDKLSGGATGPIHFDLLANSGSAPMLRSVIGAALSVSTGEVERLPKMLTWQLRESVLTAMLLDLTHDRRDLLLDHGPTSVSRVCDAAIALMRRALSTPPTIPALAAQLGVSERSLQASFREHLGTTPGAKLKQLRLEAVREALLNASAERDTVTRLAPDVGGFYHLGRFASEYLAMFGEHPSETLRR